MLQVNPNSRQTAILVAAPPPVRSQRPEKGQNEQGTSGKTNSSGI